MIFQKNKLSLKLCFPLRYSNYMHVYTYIRNLKEAFVRLACYFRRDLFSVANRPHGGSQLLGGEFNLSVCGILCQDEQRWDKRPKLHILPPKSRSECIVVIGWGHWIQVILLFCSSVRRHGIGGSLLLGSRSWSTFESVRNRLLNSHSWFVYKLPKLGQFKDV